MSYESVTRSGLCRAPSRDPRTSRTKIPAGAPSPFPEINCLESRRLLAASIAADGTLQVVGTEGPDQFTLRLGSAPNQLQVQDGSTSLFVFLLDRVRAVSIDLGAGDDTVNIDTTRGLLTAAAGDLPVSILGGAGADSVQVLGAPPAPVSQVLTLGPAAGDGTHVSRGGAAAAGPAQSLSFTGIEALSDTSIAASLSVVGNDGANVVELTSGPLAGNITPTGTLRFYDVTPAPIVVVPPPGAAAAPTPTGTSAANPASAALDSRDPAARKEAKRLAKEAKLEAKRRAKEAKRVAREQKRAEVLARKKGIAVAPPVVAPAAPSVETLAVTQTHFVVHFANKAALTIDTRGGDDRIDLNVAGAVPAGLQSLTIEAGAGADRVAEQVIPAGVVLAKLNVESTTPTRDFVLGDRAPGPQTPVPVDPPPPLPEPAAGSAATSSNDRDASSSGSASASRDSDSSSSSSSSKDSTSSNDKDEDKDNDKSKDSNASNDD